VIRYDFTRLDDISFYYLRTLVNELDFLHLTFDQQLDQEGNPVKKDVTLPPLYLVEDDQVLGKTIQKYLKKALGLEVIYFDSPATCMQYVDEHHLGKENNFCLISDISFNEGSTDGLLLVDIFKEKGLQFVSIVMTGFASIETAIMATKKGVFHYLTKPFELDVLADLVVKALVLKLGLPEEAIKQAKSNFSKNNKKNKTTNTRYASFQLEPPSEEDIFCGMIGRSGSMKSVFERIQKVACSDSTVLINGPSGTGKELVAKAIHGLSPRKSNEQVSVNCGAIPGELLESELFGHIKGSFTGAISDRKGRFELADNGTIFLDEIGDMPLLLQVKLLRVLQNREIEKVGGSRPQPINVRIIAATHRDLDKAVREGNFREDLFYRLNVIPIKIPSLCQRREDIPLLISYFLSRFVSADGRNNINFDEEVVEILMTYDWPGNVRELENLIERLVILRGGSAIRVSDLPAKFLQHRPDKLQEFNHLIDLTDDGVDLKMILSEIEDSLINQALQMTVGNKNQASKLLKMNRTTLIEKMKKKGIDFHNSDQPL
jgi:two-component system, NtrC family, response regulator PilR